jgi:hypothetical protein
VKVIGENQRPAGEAEVLAAGGVNDEQRQSIGCAFARYWRRYIARAAIVDYHLPTQRRKVSAR